ncbi:PAS domain S-box protein [Candidatus Amarobacter glycogenicus]|uniref:PAS domain-containing protein n=1 Tax=Candidatus Amarobacter glycogenicus TaxID=3140699 RepID=UPI0031CC7039
MAKCYLNAVANAIVITDVNAVVEWINPAFSTLTGYSREESVGKELGDLIGSNLNELTVVTDMWHTIREGKVWQGEVVNRRKDGSLYTEEQTITPLKDDQNNIIQFIAIKHDISARKQNEKDRLQLLAEVREQAERVRQIIDTVPEGVLLLDEFGRVILANPVGEKDLAILGGIQLGETLTHVGERPLAHFLTPPPRGQWHELTAGSRAFKLIARPIHHDLESAAGSWLSTTSPRNAKQRYQQAQEQLATVGRSPPASPMISTTLWASSPYTPKSSRKSPICLPNTNAFWSPFTIRPAKPPISSRKFSILAAAPSWNSLPWTCCHLSKKT